MSKTAIAYGRSATKDEVAARDPNIKRCQWCATETCRLAGGDHLAICGRFTAKKDAAEMSAPAPKSLAHTADVQNPVEIEQRDLRDAQKAADVAHGNAAAMREAMERAVDELDYIQQSVNPDGITISASRALRDCRAALSAPARNCDVGTAKEQMKRFVRFCRERVGQCSNSSNCPAHHPCNEFATTYCQLVWAQMPYAPAEGGDHANA